MSKSVRELIRENRMKNAREGRLKGKKAKFFFYTFFVLHAGGFTLASFFLAYGDIENAGLMLTFLGVALLLSYVPVYLFAFGLDEGRWLVTNTALGIMGITAEIDWILGCFGKSFDDFPWTAHIVPFGFYVAYTFLLRQFLLDVTGARSNPGRKKIVEALYVLVSILAYAYGHGVF